MMNRACAVLLIASSVLPSHVFAQSGQSPDPSSVASAPPAVAGNFPLRDLSKAPPVPGTGQAEPEWKASYDRAKRLRNGGIAAVFLGAAAFAGGVAFAVAGENKYSDCRDSAQRTSGHCDTPYVEAAIGLIVNGVFGTVAGIPLWIVGQVKMDRAVEARTGGGSAGQALLLPITDHHAIAVTAGRNPAVGYRLSW